MAKNKTLEAARKAYNKSNATKYRVQAGGKKTKKKEQKVKSHYGGVAKKAQDTEENRTEARTKTGSVVKTVGSNVVKGKTTDTKPTTTGVSKQNGSRSGAISPVSTKQKERQTGASTARTTAKGVGKTVKTATNLHKAKTEVTDVTQGTARGTAAGTAFNKSKAAEKALEKAGEKKTITVKKDQLTAEQKAAQEQAARATRFYTNSLVASGRITQKEADDAVEKAKKKASKGVKEDHTLTYSNATQSNEKVQRVANASKFTNVEVEDKKAKEKAIREARFYTNSQVAAGNMSQKEADKIVKEAGKGHRTTQSANILDKLGGDGEAERQGTRQAGQMNDSKFASGVMQGMSYGDNTRAVGKYNKQAAELVDTVKQSGAFNAGYMTGQGLQFMLGGTNKMTDALVKGVAKSGAARSALNIGLRKGGADMLFESPLNTLDAIKMSTDANGNFDKKAFAKYMALNAGLSGGMGGAIGGIGAKMTKEQARSYLELSAKAQRGLATEDDLVKLGRIQKKFEDIRQGNDVAKTDIIDRADYDAKVHNEVLTKSGNANDAVAAMNGASTHSEKMNYAATIKENADAQFEALKAEREILVSDLKNASPEDQVKIRKQLAENQQELNRIGGIANVAERELEVSEKRNRRAVQNLAESAGKMKEATGVNYRVMNDRDMRKAISDDMARRADELEAHLDDFTGDARAQAEARIEELRRGTSDDLFYKGYYYKNAKGETEIIINSESPQAHQTVMGHETGHLIKSMSEDEFFKLGGQLENYAKKMGDWDAVYEQLRRAYPDASRKDLREEVTCELLGRYVYGKNDAFIKQLAGEQPSVLQRIVEYVKNLLSKTTDSEMAKELQAIIDKTDSLVRGVGEANSNKTNVPLKDRTVVEADENIAAKELDESGITVESDGKPVAQYDEDGSFKFSVSSYEHSGRAELNKYLDNLVKKKEMTKVEADQMRSELEKIYKVCREYADSGKYAPFSQWSDAKVVIGEDGKPVFSSVKKNSEYEMNIDFSTICKKRRTLDAVFNELVARGVVDAMNMSTLDSAKFVVKMNDIIRKHGFEAACEVCFVEARRYRQQATAQAFADLYNDLVKSMYKDESKIAHFNYGGDRTISDVADGIHTMDDSSIDLSHIEKVMEDERKKAADKLEKEIPSKTGKARADAEKKLEGLRNGTIDAGTVEAKAARLLYDNPSQRKLLQVGDMMGSKGFETLKVQNPELEKIYNAKKGTGGAKSSFGDVQYLNEIINSTKFKRDAAYAVGGVRVQSFSDYVPRMVFDYVQMVGDLAAKRLPMHSYTKEPLFAKQFGLSGIKINLSLVPKYADDGVAAGLDKNGKYLWNENGTFPYDEAVKIQNAEGYKDNCGTIAVGVSDEHIRKMLDDPNIQMIIPYHKSSLNPVIADMTNVKKFTNYEKFQTTKNRAGKSISESKDFPFNEELYKLSHGEDGKLLPRDKWGDPRELSNRYLKWCDDNGYTPKFPQFRDNKNYYKLLEDFGLYDSAGNFKPQHDVQMRFPEDGDAFGSMKDLIKSGLEEDAILEGKRTRDIPSITDEVIGVAKENGWLSDEPKFSVASKGAIGADTSAADLAEKLRKDGLRNDEIKEITGGWYVAQDGKARFQFSDADFKIKDDVFADYHPEKTVSDNRYITAAERVSGAMREYYDSVEKIKTTSPKKYELINRCRSDKTPIKELRSKLRDAAKNGEIEDATLDENVSKAYNKVLSTNKALSKLGRGKEYPESIALKNLVEHDKLFEYYPDAKEIRVFFASEKELGGASGDFSGNAIRVSRGETKEELEDTLIHEIQHWIQDKEGLATGASTKFWDGVYANFANKINGIINELPTGARRYVYGNKVDAKGAVDAVRKELGAEKAKEVERLISAVEELSGNEWRGGLFNANTYKTYRKTLGELEAFHASEKRHLTQKDIDNGNAPAYANVDAVKTEDFIDKTTGGYKFSKERKQPLKEANTKAEVSKAKLDDLNAARTAEEKTAGELSRKQRNTAMFSNAKDKAERLKEIRAQKAESDARLAEIDKQIKAVNKEIAEAQKVIDGNADRLASGRKAKTADRVENWRNEIDGYEKEIADKQAQIKELDKANLNKMTPLQADGHLDKRNALVHEIEDLQSKIESRNDKIQKSTLIKAQRDAVNAPEAKPQTKEAKPEVKPQTETQKVRDNKYASDKVKTALDDIEKAGVYTKEAEKASKRFNNLDEKIGAQKSHIENAKKSTKYATEEERAARVAELEDELRTLQNQQAKAAGKIEQMGKMKAVDDSLDPQDQFHQLRGDTAKANTELKNADNLKNEDNWIKDKWNSVRRLWEDSLIEVENVAKRSDDKKLREEILTAANRVRNSQNVANFWITQGRSTFDNKVSGKALDEIFTKELLEDEVKYKDFQEYLIMKHVPARHAKGTDIYPEVSPELADKIVKKLEGKYGKELTDWADDVYGYLKDLQQYRVDSGMLSKEAADKFAKDYPFYVPTNRVNEDEAIDFFTGGLSNQIRTAKGGENDVLDMYSQLYTATNKTIHAAEENEMLNLYFRAKGVTPEQIKGAELPDLEHAVIEAKVNKKNGNASVSFFVDGKPVEFPCSHQLALGLRELDGLEFERLLNAAKMSTLYGKPLKALITDWNLVFGVRNGMRDMQQAVVNSKDTRYFGSSFGAAGHAIACEDNPYRKLYASMGGERAQLVSYDAVAKNLGIEKQGKVDALHEKVQDWVDADIKGKHINPVHYIEGINGAIEMMPRMCEFIGTLRKQADNMLKQQGSSLKKLRKEIIAEVEADKSIGQSMKSAEVENRLAQKVIDMVDKDTIDSAMRNANDITLNFGRSGVLGKALNMGFVPYLNPSIQGLSKLVRLFTEAGGEGGWKSVASIGMKLGTFTIAPAVWNELALRNNEEYQNLNTRDKDNNFFIALGDGKFIKIPKPRENAVLAEPVEYGLRYFLDKSEYAFFDWDKLKMEDVPLWEKIPLTDEGKQSLRTALDNIGVINPMTSNMVSPLWQTFHNKTWYGGSIESAYETAINEDTGKANVPVNKRYDTGTSGVAIWLGQSKVAKELNLSPKKIDNILDSYTGMIYDLGISQTTEEAKTRGNYLLRTAASQFMKDSVFSNKLSTKAWEKIDGMSKKEQDEYKSKYMYDAYKYDDAMDAITADKNMTVKEKMEAKRFLQKQRNKLYRAAINGEENTTNPLKDISKYLGANKTLNKFLPKSGDEQYDNWTDYYKNYKKTKGYKGLTPAQKEKEAQKFLDVYTLGVKGQSKISSDFHDSPSWGMTGVAAAQRYKQGKLSQKDAKTIMESCGVYESQTESYFKYADHGGNVSRYAVTKKNNKKAEDLANELGVTTKGDGSIWKNKYSKEKGIKGGVLSMSLATGKADFKDRAYYISNSGDSNMLIKMNAARGYAEKYGHTTKQLIKLGKKADADGNTYLSNEEIESACNTIKGGKATSEEKAMGWVLLGGNPNKNPFGAIGDYSHDGDTGITMDDDGKSGGHGRRGRGRRGRGGGGGGSKKGTMPKTESGAIKGKVTDVFATSNGSKSSNLNDAYRKKVRKLRKELR